MSAVVAESDSLLNNNGTPSKKPFPDWSSPKLWVDIILSIAVASLLCWIICCFVGDATLAGVWVTYYWMHFLSFAIIVAATVYFTYFYFVEWDDVSFFTRFGTIGTWTGVICYAWCYWVSCRAESHNMDSMNMKHNLRG
jgi:hypothetical protein